MTFECDCGRWMDHAIEPFGVARRTVCSLCGTQYDITVEQWPAARLPPLALIEDRTPAQLAANGDACKHRHWIHVDGRVARCLDCAALLPDAPLDSRVDPSHAGAQREDKS